MRVTEKEGELWFVAKDVATALEYPGSSLTNMARLTEHVPSEWKGRNPIPTPGGEQDMFTLSEQGLYFFLARSDKPKALPYQKWIAGDVMPSIRKFGGYLTPDKMEEALLNPDTVIRLATALKEEQAKRVALEAKTEEDRPKVLFAESVSASTSSILVGQLANLISQNGIKIGQNRLFQWMRDNDFLIANGSRRNSPTQRAMEMGLFEVKERTINNPDGSIRIMLTTKVTGKGQIYFVNRFLKKANAA